MALRGIFHSRPKMWNNPFFGHLIHSPLFGIVKCCGGVLRALRCSFFTS